MTQLDRIVDVERKRNRELLADFVRPPDRSRGGAGVIRDAHIICYSGGEASALTAIEVSRKHGTGALILLNHDIHENSEDADIKRFKVEVAAYIGVPVTYANMPGWERKDQFDVVVEAGAFKGISRS